jgi:hypothetical protein
LRHLVAAIGLCASEVSQLIVLYRALNMNYPKNKAESYYQKTLLLFVSGPDIAFIGIFVVMIESFILKK